MADVTALLPTRRRAEAFARVLDTRRTGSISPDMTALAALADALQAIGATAASQPTADFRARLRDRLVTEAPDVLAQTRQGEADTPAREGAPRSHRRERDERSGRQWLTNRRTVALATSAGLALGAGGAGVASASAVPGDGLYGMKRVTESWRLQLAGSGLDRGKLELDLAARRLGEVEQLLGDPRSLAGAPGTAALAAGPLSADDLQRTRTTLADMDANTRTGADTLLDVYAEDDDARALHELDSFARTQHSRLTALLPTVPAELRPDIRSSLALLDQLGQQAVHQLERAEAADRSGCEPVPCSTPKDPASWSRDDRSERSAPATPDGNAGQPKTDQGSDGPAVPPGSDSTPGGAGTEPDDSDGSGEGSGGGLGDALHDLLGGGGDSDPPSDTPSEEPSSPPASSTGLPVDPDLPGTVDKAGKGAGDAVQDTTDGVGDAVDGLGDGLTGGGN